MAIPIINVSILNGSNGFRLDGADRNSDSVSSAGDINGDGFDDVMVGVSSSTSFYGFSYLVFGKGSDFSATVDLTNLDGNSGFRFSSNYEATLVSDAGDVNGDGFDDVIIGASGVYDYYYPNIHDGASYVVFGRASGFAADITSSNLDGSNGFYVDVPGSLPISVSGAGDINGDGFDDVIIGSANADPNGSGSGSSYVIFGKASGFTAKLDLFSLDGSNGFRLDGVAALDGSGFRVSSAGDINGDGFDDVLVGASRADPNGNESGASYVVFGRASGFSAALNLSSLDGSNGFRLNGVGTDDNSGSSVSNAGDVNGDGFDDVLVGASRADPNGNESGASYVVFGRASGFDAELNLSSLDGSNGFRLDGVAMNDFSGLSVSSAGDVNGDGFADVIVGAFRADPNGNESGASYVVFGRASGFAATMDLLSLDGNNGFRLDGATEGDFFGASVSSAGDVNDDGFDDLIVGAPGADSGGDSYVIFGGDFITGEAVYLGTAGDDSFTGTILAERFEAGGGNDSMIGLGGADIFRGDGGDDTIAVADLEFQQIDGGIGTDTLKLTDNGINLNLANFHDTIDGIETIDLTGNGNNTLTLTLPDLLSLSDTTDIFTVNGNVGDRVVGLTNSGWTDGGIEDNYRVFTNHGTVLRVNETVHIDVPMAGVINLADLDGNNGFRLDGAVAYELSAQVSSAGDINGDGFDDVIIGAGGDFRYGTDPGSSYVIFGKASGFDASLDLSDLDGNNGFRIDGVAEGDESGRSVSNAGDVNGDGFDDVIIGAYKADPNGERSGSSYVVFGKASEFDATLDLSSLDGNNGFRLDGVAAYNDSGYSVGSAGDINGDGLDDLIVGARRDPNDFDSYVSYVVFGKASGFSVALNLSSLNGNNGFRLDGAAGDLSGKSASSAGDINGDGFDDVIIGAPFAASNGKLSGVSYVVFGRASGFAAALDLSSLDGSNGFRLDGATEYDYSGESVSNAGDINGDGFDDVIIGAYKADPNGERSGSSYVVFGKASGFDAAMNLSSLDGSNGFRLDGVESSDYSGRAVSNAGDVNGDGFDDLLVGAYKANPNGSDNAGSSYVVFGKASGFGATLDLFRLDGSNGFRLDGVASQDYSGYSVSGGGDVNGDGFDDLIVGAPGADPNGDSSGSSYVIFGRSDFGGGGELPKILGTPGNDNLTGTSAAEIFEAGDGNDKMIGRGGADVFRGGAGDDYIQVADLGFASVDGGSGNDTLHLDGKDLNLDLASFGDNIHGIEAVCLYGRGDNTLTLTAPDLLNLSDTTNTLRVNGNAGDHVTVLDDGWVDGGPRGSGYYHVYTNDDAVLLVGQNVTVDFV